MTLLQQDMRPSEVGEKRPRDTPASFNFIPGLTLSKHPFEQRKGLFMEKLIGINNCKSLHPTQFEGYTIKERFKRMGWENLLSFNCDKIYTRVVEQWMASLIRTGDELTGIVDGKSYTITPKIIRDLLGVDTRTDLPYTRFKEEDFKAATAENNIRWTEACKTVFGREENVEIKAKQGYEISMITPLAKVLWEIANSTFHSCDYLSTMTIYPREIHLLHALLTGDYTYLYSCAHLMIDEIWDMYEQKHRRYIPYGNYISEILCRLGAVSEDENVRVIPPMHRVISVESFLTLKFLNCPTAHIIYDIEMQELMIFRKEGTREAQPQPQPTNLFSQTYQDIPPQMSVPNPNMEMTDLFTKFQNLIDKQSSIFQKQYDEMKSMVTNIQKQMEHQALEAARREQAREKQAEIRERKQYDEIKTMVTNMQKQMERQALEAARHEHEREKLAEIREKRAEERERRAEEREKQAEIRAKEGGKLAEEREKLAKERERQADKREKRGEMWTHAIIWDIERQRYFYEMEQEQLRMAWNQLNGANAVNEFQLPQMSRTSLHPPQEGSPYYDPTQGDDIPTAFQPLYQDIYGPRRKKPSSA